MAKALHNVALLVALLSATFLVGVHSSSVLEANLPARIAQVATSGISCSGNFTPTTTFMYSGLCTNFSDTSCWTPHFPTASDIALIPTGVSAVYGNPSNLGLFSLLSLNTLIISPGATLTMPSQALQVTNCFVVHGLLNLTASPVGQNYSAPTASTPYLADPAQPENTDCLLVSVGFTPRICGPGKLLVSSTGSVVLANYYSSLFIETDIAAGGQFLALTNSFIWGKVTNNGTFNASGFIYMHGYLFNHGTATLDAVAFDKWATSFVESPPLLIENYGSLTFFNSIHATIATYSGSAGVYKAALLNYKNLYFAITEKGSAVASTDFDLFNFGLVKWYDTTNQYWQGNWGGSGNYVNHGEFLADSVAVYLSTYHGVGGRLVHNNYGSYSFGSGSLNPRTVKLCTMQESMQKSLKNVQRAEKRPNMNSVVQRDGCWWYGDFCYHTPYIFSPPLLKTEQLPPRNVMTHHSIAVQLSKMINSVAVPSPCTQRYSFSEKSVIRGDGTGSVVTTMPVFIEDSLTVRLGGKWYALTENGVPPVWGGGVVRVANGGEMYLGLDADFNHDGKLIVERGGHLSIPKHAKVTVSNHTISIQAGGIFHVDGKLSTNVLSERIRNCGELRGVGRILKSKEDDLQC